MRKKFFLTIILLVFFLSFSFNVCLANETVDYTVRPLLSKEQTTDVTDYFDLKLAPNNKYQMMIELKNKGTTDIQLELFVENSITNANGIIEYGHDYKNYDESLKIKLTDLTTIEREVSLPAKSTKQIPLSTQLTEKTFDGIILGAVRVTEKTAKPANEQKSMINNTYSYVVPIKIRQNDTAISPKLNFLGVTIGQQKLENVVLAKLQNPKPDILRDLTLNAAIFQKNKTNSLYTQKTEAMKLAPNSNFQYSIPLGKEKFKAGSYRLELSASAQEYSEKWVEEFEITSKEAKELNNQLVIHNKETNFWWYLLALILFLLIVGLIIYVLRKQSKQKQIKKELEQTNKTSKRRKRKKN